MCNAMPSKYKKVDVSCSCTKCDSVFCLAKENDLSSCSCEDCPGSDTCLFYSSLDFHGGRLDAPNAFHSSSRTLPGVVSEVARYIASSVAQLVTPQMIKSTCCATTSRTNDTGTNTIELYRKLNSVPPKYTMEQFKKTYLSQKNKVIAPILACDADICQTEQNNFLPRKIVPSDRTVDIYRTELLKQKLAAAALKNIYLPGFTSNKKPEEMNCHFDKSSKYALEKSIGYVMDVKNNNQISHCHENKPIKPVSECFETHILDSKWDTIETPGNQYSRKSQNCTCIECMEKRDEAREFDPPGYIMDLPKAKHGHNSMPCSCKVEESKPPKLCRNIPPTTQEAKCASISEFQQGGNECKSRRPCQCKSHEKNECLKCTENKSNNFDTAGYVIDLPTDRIPIKKCVDTLKINCYPHSTFFSYQYEEQNPVHKMEQKPEIESKGSCQCTNPSEKNISKSLFYSQNSKIRNTQELYQCHLEPQIYNDRKKNSCECNVSRKPRHESSGYVLELQQYQPTKNAQELVENLLVTELPDMDMFEKKECECKVKPKSKHEVPGYVFDIPKKQKCCNDDNKSSNINMGCKCKSFSSSGYIADLPKRKPRKEGCGCKGLDRNGTKSYGRVFELPKPIPKTPTKMDCKCPESSKSKFEINRLELPCNNSNKNNEACVCKGTAKCRSSSTPGYVIDLPKTGNDGCACSKPTKLPSADNKYSKRECCGGQKHEYVPCVKETNKNQEVSRNKCCEDLAQMFKTERPGYVFDLPKHKSSPRKEGCGCKGLDRNKTESYGCGFDLSKPIPKTSTKMDCKCPESSKSKFDINRLDIPCDNSKKNNESCVCKGTAKCRSSSTPGYVLDLPKTGNDGCACSKPKPTKQTCVENKYGSKCECSGGPKHGYVPCGNETYKNQEVSHNKCCEDLAQMFKTERSGYVFDLPKHKSSPRKEGCGCKGFDLPKPIPKTTTKMDCKCRESSKSKFDINRHEIPCDNSKKDNESCVCKGTAKCRSSSTPGYVLDLPKTGNDGCACSKPTKPTCVENKYSSSDCSGPPKQEYIPCRSNNQEVSRNKELIARYVLDLPTVKPQKIGNQCECCDKVNQPTYPPKPIPKRNCECSASENKVDLSKYVYELPKQRSASSSNCGCRDSKHKLKSEFHQPPCTPKPIKQKKICECSPKTKEHIMPLDLSGYVSDSNTLNKRDGACTPAKENRYVLDLAKRRSTDHKPNKCECALNKKSISNANLIYRIETTVISPETQNVCNNMLEKQLDTYDLLKNLYAPGSTSKKYIDLCKNILKTQTDTIEILKKIYLPQKEFSKSPRSSDEPTKYPHLSKDDISKIPFSKESQLTEAESEKAAKLLRTAMLGTKVMDLPYKEFDDSLVPKQSEMDKKSKLSKYDILKRIKEAYKACSCKVCECIAGKVKTETCQCKPCECNECLSYMNKTEKIKTSKNDMNVDNKYRGTSNQQMCDCKPCDCADCTRTMKKLCDSEPCHCVECKTKSIHKRQTLVVAPVGREENVQRLACTCSPCDCIECGLIHSMASNAMHEMSTGTSRHAQCRCEICLNEVCNQRDINACSCQKRKKVISKPVDQGTHDFDIRTATTNHTKPLYSRRENKSSNHDTIAMYAAVPTNYHGLTSNEDISSKDNMCNCDECEFLNYVCQKEAVMDIKSSQAFSSSRTITKSDLNVCSKSVLNSYEDCTSQRSCSCQLCKRQYDYTHHIYTSASYLSEDCECDPYECIKCGGDLMPNRYPSNTSCESVKSKPPFDNKYREEKLATAKPLIKKGEGYPSTRKLTKQSSKPSIQASKMRPSTKISSITNANLSDLKKPQPVNQKYSIKEGSSSYLFGYSSNNISSITSGHNKYDSNTIPMSRKKYKSWESSCNSSGYDYPEYLIQFPQSTVGDDLKNAMGLNNNQTKYSHKSNLSSRSDSNSMVDKLSCDDISTREITTDKTSILDIFNPEMTSNKQNGSKNPQQRQKCHDSNNIFDEISHFHDVYQNAVITSSQFYKLEMKKRSEYQKNKKITSTTAEENFQDSHLLLDNKSSLKNDNKNTKYFNLFNDVNDFHLGRKVFDSNKVQNKNTSAILPARSVGLNNMWFPITIPRLSFMNSTDILVADLKRVRKTLREAKEFSLELMRLLNMYENANKEFECVSHKLKLSYACLIGSDMKVKKQESGYIKETNQKQEKTYNRIENELHGRQSIPPSAELNVDLRINTIISDNNISKLKNARDYDITSQDVAHRRKQNRLEDEIELHLNSDEQFCNDMANVESVKQIEVTESNKVKEDKQMEKVLTNDSFSRIKEISAGIDKDERKNNQINEEDYKKYKRSKTRNSNGLKAKSFHHQIKYRVAVGTSTDNNSTSINRSKTKLLVNFSEKVDQRNNNAQEHCKDLKQIMKKIDSVFAGIEQITASTSTETKALDDHFNNAVISHEIKETSPWPILRKNFSWNARPQTKNEISNFQKQRTHSVSQQTATPRKRRHENKTLASLQVEVQKLLDMPRLESQQCYQSC